MKRMMKAVCAALLTMTITACAAGKGPEQPENTPDIPDTLGGNYLSVFVNSSAKSAEDAAEELIKAGYLETELVSMEVQPGYLDGFDAEITGFTKGVKFSPMIGAIPFVGYVLESDQPQDVLDQLNEHADLRWNICTEADEQLGYIRDNLVFYIMCSNES